MPRCTVGGGQAEHESRRVDGREEDMVIRVGKSLVLRERRSDKEDKRAASPRELIRRCQGLAEG